MMATGSPPGTDPTMEFLRRFDDAASWHVVPNVPIFCPHDRKVTQADGSVKVLYTVDEDDLEEICDRYRRLSSTRAVVPRITIGHTQRDAREEDQPDVVGFARNLRVGTFGPEATPCILCDAYYRRDCWPEARKYPYRSVEYYPRRKEIAGVSLLKRDPELDLGIVLAERAETAVLYETHDWLDRHEDELLVLYQRGVNMPDPALPPMADKPDTPMDAPMDETGMREDYERHCYSHPYARQHHEGMLQKYAAMPGGDNMAPPAPAGGPPMPKGDDDMDQMQRRDLASNYARIDAENKQLKTMFNDMAVKLTRSERRQDLQRLLDAGVSLNLEEELTDCMGMNAEQYSRHLKRIETKYERDPAGGGMLPISNRHVEGNADTGETITTRDRLERCYQYMREHNCGIDEAKKNCG